MTDEVVSSTTVRWTVLGEVLVDAFVFDSSAHDDPTKIGDGDMSKEWEGGKD